MNRCSSFPNSLISIHAPPRGATRTSRRRKPEKHFNSRPSARGDTSPDTTTGRDNHISIHAPPRGATLQARRASGGLSHFNSRPSARGDIKNCHTAPAIKFQFTPLREGRRARRCPARLHPLDFNSRPSARGDRRSAAASNDCHAISIHAPPRWATCGAPDTVTFRFISIHAPPRGATTKTPAGALARRISIHAPPRGATGQLGEKNQND